MQDPSKKSKKSTHRVEVFEIQELLEHPNADRLQIVPIWNYRCIVGKDQFKPGDLAAYIVPDSMVPLDRPEFEFLKDRHKGKMVARVRVAKFRGHISQGLLVPAPEGSKPGDDVSELLGVSRYEPPLDVATGGMTEKPPAIASTIPFYDVDDWHRYAEKLNIGEEVLITEKLNGSNACYIFSEGRMWCKSRKQWVANTEKSLWWATLKFCPEIAKFCEEHPDVAVFGEAVGKVKNWKYGLGSEVKTYVFDIWQGHRFLDVDEARELGKELPWAPELYRGPYDPMKAKKLSDGESVLEGANHRREGIVIRPVKERRDSEIGRVQLKIVSDISLLKEKD